MHHVSAYRVVVIACITFLLSACSSPSIDQYAQNKPAFNVPEFFQGPLVAHGILKNRSGEVTRYFTATLNGSWKDGVGTLAEQFTFDDGEQQERIWTLVPNEQGYHATAGDVIGSGQLTAKGNAAFMSYVLRVPYDDSTLDVTVDDRMYRVSPDVVINESTLYKFGLEVGYLTLSIRRLEP